MPSRRSRKVKGGLEEDMARVVLESLFTTPGLIIFQFLATSNCCSGM
jgi:hypothetical protein